MPVALTVGRHATVPATHPLYAGLRARLTIPHPEYEEAVRLGKRPVVKKRDPNGGKTKSGRPLMVEVPLPRVLELYEELGNTLLIPRGIAAEWAGRYPVMDQRVAGHLAPMRFLRTLRPHQQPFVDTLSAALGTMYGCVGKADAGFGKTVCGAALMAAKSVTTLVIVHKEFLMSQWVERLLGSEVAAQYFGVALNPDDIQAPCLDLRPEDIGIVQQDRCEWEGKKVVIAMAQSLLAREYDPAFYEYFGLVMVDEVHRFAAPTFQKTIVLFPAAMRLGLTATVERADGLEQVVEVHIGPVVAEGKAPRRPPRIYQVKTPVVLTEQQKRRLLDWSGRRPDYTKTLGYLAGHDARNRFLAKHAVEAFEHGRRVIVFSHRLEHLQALWALIETQARAKGLNPTLAYYVGGMKLAERKQAEKAEVLLATYAMGKEGLDIPSLNTLVMGTPVKDVEQLVGRVQRQLNGEKEPVVVDPVDRDIKLCVSLADKRNREYRALGWR